jgi:hypothetical protein
MDSVLARLEEILDGIRDREAGDPESYPARTITELYAIGVPTAPFPMALGGASGNVTQESTRLCADLFALSGGRHYRRTSPVARLLSASFAGTALRPPLMMEGFALESAAVDAGA